MLELKSIVAQYGHVRALKGISLTIHQGENVTLLGANGAGKSTTLKCISGLLRISSGSILFQGERIDHLPPHKIIREGITQVMEGRRLFPDLDVLENLRLGAYLSDDRQAIQQRMDRVFGYFPILKERQKQLASTFSGGEQQMLAMGRGLMASPNLLMLDEPSLGLAPILVQEVGKIIRTINRDGVTLLLIEQNAQMALRLANRGYVMETGSIALEGTSQELISNDKVRKAYMGL
ncbi:MAG TPA: ABC transporter ATP-binding protein [Thermodesulfobacteriota bacterium]|nr:ABC transporter ATP-binding protein [Thermodesulfobacteriota bacterium]